MRTFAEMIIRMHYTSCITWFLKCLKSVTPSRTRLGDMIPWTSMNTEFGSVFYSFSPLFIVYQHQLMQIPENITTNCLSLSTQMPGNFTIHSYYCDINRNAKIDWNVILHDWSSPFCILLNIITNTASKFWWHFAVISKMEYNFNDFLNMHESFQQVFRHLWIKIFCSPLVWSYIQLVVWVHVITWKRNGHEQVKDETGSWVTKNFYGKDASVIKHSWKGSNEYYLCSHWSWW